MHTLLVIALALLCFQHANAHLLYNNLAVVSGIVRTTVADLNATVEIGLLLKQDGIEAAEALLYDIADPTSSNYLNWLTKTEVNNMIRPTDAHVAAVTNWLTANNISFRVGTVFELNDAYTLDMTVQQCNNLFNTTMWNYLQNGVPVIYSYGTSYVPGDVYDALDMVLFFIGQGPDYIMQRVSAPNQSRIPSSYVTATSTFLYNQYGFPDRLSYVLPNGTQKIANIGVVELTNYFDPADLLYYGQQTGFATPFTVDQYGGSGLNIPNISYTSLQEIENAYGEATLDVQALLAANPAAEIWFYEMQAGDTLLDWAGGFLSLDNYPNVVSISYSSPDLLNPVYGCYANCSDHVGLSSESLYKRMNMELMKITMLGVTIVASSGDYGANSVYNLNCTYSDPQQSLIPALPADSPFVLGVGATELDPVTSFISRPANVPACSSNETFIHSATESVLFNSVSCNMNGIEQAVSIAVSGFTSGGGFSWNYARPRYQDIAVGRYLNSSIFPNSTFFNASNRAFPDIAAYGSTNWYRILDGLIVPVGGTSLSAPLIAGMISIMNEHAMKVRGKPLGFVNPLFYHLWEQDSTIFTDIVTGDNIYPTATATDCQGYRCEVGYDAVTGLGTPNFPKLMAAVDQVLNEGAYTTYSTFVIISSLLVLFAILL